MYSINVTTTRVQEESLFLTKPHVWYNTTGNGWSQAAIIIINTGGKDVVIDKITVRGQEINWTYVFYWRTTDAITQDLQVTSTQLNISESTASITVAGSAQTFTQATGDLTLRSGYTMVIYIDSPDSITVSDVGTTVGITIFSASAQYYKEVNVEAAQ
jgi:acid phosphatase class B